ncbi:hypothetical protein Angca_001174 [Angiostrongylus cantonensis]|nr:hypothetical protein Angca_001174 [Angiostrongylus cantonensis]
MEMKHFSSHHLLDYKYMFFIPYFRCGQIFYSTESSSSEFYLYFRTLEENSIFRLQSTSSGTVCDVRIGCVNGITQHRSCYHMGLKPVFLRVLAYTVMEDEKFLFTDAEMLLKKQDSPMFPVCSPRVVHKTGQSPSVKLNGLPSKDPVPKVCDGTNEAQRPLHIHVNGFGKPSTVDKQSSSSHSFPSVQYSSSSATSNDGCSSAVSTLESVKRPVPSPLPSPSCASNVRSTTKNPPGVSGTSGPLIPSSFASRREVEVTRRKTVVDKIIKGREANAFKFFVSGFESQTPTQLAVAARRLKSAAEEKMPRHMVMRIYGEEEARNVKKRLGQPQFSRPNRYVNQEYDDSTDLSDVEVKDKVDSVALKWNQVKVAVSSDMAKNAVQVENAVRQIEDLDGFLCADGQEPSCSSHVDSCARIRPLDTRYTHNRRTRYCLQLRFVVMILICNVPFILSLRSENYRLNETPYSCTRSCALDLSQVNCPPLRYMEAFARLVSMGPAFSVRSRIDVPIWLNRDFISEERRRCTTVQFDDIDDGDRVPKLKRMRLIDRSPFSSTGSSSMEESEDERKDKSYTICGYNEKRRQEIRRSKNRRKQRRRTRRLLGVESDSESEESLDSCFRVKLEMPKYSDIEVPTWRKLSQEQVVDLMDHRIPSGCCNSTRIETLVARRHLRLAKEERLYFEGKRREMPRIDSDDASEAEGIDLSPLLKCSLTENERSQYDRSGQFHGGREPLQRPR